MASEMTDINARFGTTTLDGFFLARLRDCDRRSVARAISIVEDGGKAALSLLHEIRADAGCAWRVGITGPPGAGKSTLTNVLALALRRLGQKVAIIAVDPSSPFTSGAVLGDRVRMAEIDRDPDIFIRSIATRGRSGGLSATTQDAADVLDAAGYETVFIESVGVGQVELDIKKVVDTTLMVLVPESGDQVQAIKAGLMEIADLYVLNKSDRPDASRAASAITSSLTTNSERHGSWHPRVLKAAAIESQGIDEILLEIDRHRTYLVETGNLELQRAVRAESRIRSLTVDLITQGLWDESRTAYLSDSLDAVQAGEQTPHAVAADIVSCYFNQFKGTSAL